MHKNLNLIKKVSIVVYTLLVFMVGGDFVVTSHNIQVVLAQDQTQDDPPDQTQNDSPTSSTTSSSSGEGFNLEFEVPNPIKVDTFEQFIKNLLGVILTIGIPIVVIFIIYSGFLFVVAQGNEEKLKSAKQNFLYVVIGSAILLGAWVLAQAIDDTVNCVGGGTNC